MILQYFSLLNVSCQKARAIRFRTHHCLMIVASNREPVAMNLSSSTNPPKKRMLALLCSRSRKRQGEAKFRLTHVPIESRIRHIFSDNSVANLQTR